MYNKFNLIKNYLFNLGFTKIVRCAPYKYKLIEYIIFFYCIDLINITLTYFIKIKLFKNQYNLRLIKP